MAESSEALSSTEQWKRKYYESLEAIEQKEQRWKQLEEVLRKTISRLALAADGLDATLDKQLRDLRNAIRDRVSEAVLMQRIEVVSRTLVRLDSARLEKSHEAGPADALGQLLERLDLPAGSARQIKTLKKQLRQAGPAELEPLIKAFAGLLKSALVNAAGSASASPPPQGSVLGRLFGKRNKGQRGEPEAANAGPAGETPAPGNPQSSGRQVLFELMQHIVNRDDAEQFVSELRNRIQRARSAEELQAVTRSFAEAVEFRSASRAGPEEPVAGWSVQQVLIELLQEFHVPVELQGRVEAIREHIERPPPDFDVWQTVHEIASLVSEMRGRLECEKEEIEHFLSQMTERLHEIDACVSGTESIHNDSYRRGRELGDAVQAEVQGIESSVEDADNIDQLKCTVRERVETILARVETHRREEQTHQAQMQAEVQKLRERVQDMEQETEGLQARVQSAHEQALTDALTGIPNRQAYDERIEQEFARWKRFETPLALLVWDVDYFKKINDTYGHMAGDKVLQAIARVLGGHIRETDFLARYGGEEFAMMMPGATAAVALKAADKLRREVETCGFHYHGTDVTITISCGISQFRTGDTTETVFERADRALYAAKQAGRNRVQAE
jgi:diguanylate cyclase